MCVCEYNGWFADSTKVVFSVLSFSKIAMRNWDEKQKQKQYKENENKNWNIKKKNVKAPSEAI